MKNEIAENWKFNFDSISEEDKELCLNLFFGDYLANINESDRNSEDIIAMFELNALIASELLKKEFQKITLTDGTKGNLWDILTHNKLTISERIANHYLGVDSESPIELVEKHENIEVQEILKKYSFQSN
jgi:hypothetical protein